MMFLVNEFTSYYTIHPFLVEIVGQMEKKIGENAIIKVCSEQTKADIIEN